MNSADKQKLPGDGAKLSRGEIASWLRNALAAELGIDADEVDGAEPFTSYGLSSLNAVSIAGDLEELLHCRLSETLLWSYPTLDALAEHLATFGAASEAGTFLHHEGASSSEANGDIAIVGMGCRFPDAPSVEAFWELLANGVDAVREVPPSRWRNADFYHQDSNAPGKMNTRWGAFLDHVGDFDPAFFGISPAEAERMDPQQRLLLEVAWETLEGAGIAPRETAAKRVGVFVGLSHSDYAAFQMGSLNDIDAYAGSGNALSIAANRISYFFNWHGPSLAVDTACSSSLVSVHLACQSLRTNECDAAMAGGVNLILRPEVTIAFSHASMMSPDGRCKTFDATANGYVRGEGCGLVLLKRLADAQRDGDNVLAVIKGSALNHDGRTNGLTAPNGLMQEALLRQAWANAGVGAENISYIEAHGTGTPLGDPIEMEAIKAALGEGAGTAPCYVGSVKTNLGHLEAAAGIAGLIKVVLMLQHGKIVPHLHLNDLNPHIKLENTRIKVATEKCEAPKNFFAGVSAFGFGGTCAHTVLAAAPQRLDDAALGKNHSTQVLCLSARTEAALRAQLTQYARCLLESDASYAEICHTANAGRNHFPHRVALCTDTREAAQGLLQRAADGRGPTESEGYYSAEVHPGASPKIAFHFTGQGIFYPGMGKSLYEAEPIFRETLDRCAKFLEQRLPLSLTQYLFEDFGDESPLRQTEFSQPVIFSLGVSLYEVWKSWGVRPTAVFGQSLGEYMAAYAAGVYTLEDALGLVCERGRIMQSLPQDWSLLMAFAGAEHCGQCCTANNIAVEVAGYNGPNMTLLGVRNAALAALQEALEAAGIAFRPVQSSHAFHTAQLDPVLDSFAEIADRVPHAKAALTFVSSLDGAVLAADADFGGAYWRAHMRQAVRLDASVQTLLDAGYYTIIDIGASPFVLRIAQDISAGKALTLLPTLQKGRDAEYTILPSLAKLEVRGVEVDWKNVRKSAARRVALPTYPFQRKRYWFTPSATPQSGAPSPEISSQSHGEVRVNPDDFANDLLKLQWEFLDSPADGQTHPKKSWLLVSESACAISKLIHDVLQSQEHNVRSVSFEDDLNEAWADDAPDRVLLVAPAGEDEIALCSQVAGFLRTYAQHDWHPAVPPQLWLISQGAQFLPGDKTPPNLAQATLWGLGRVAALELSEAWGGLLDLPAEESNEIHLALGFLENPPADRQLALRDGKIFAARLHPASAWAYPSSSRKLRFRTDASYVVSGGLGALGLSVAWWMLWNGARNLVLLGRRALPPREAWQDLPASHPQKESVSAILSMEALGAKVAYWGLDVAEESTLTQQLRAYLAEGNPPFRGVVHAAGVLEDQSLAKLDVASIARVMRPKTKGALSLQVAMQDQPLDFFVLFSSAASLLGSPGQAAYAAANAGLDALAQRFRSGGVPAICVNWGPWQGLGMAENASVQAQLARQGVGVIPKEHGLAALYALMLQDVPHAAMVPLNLAALLSAPAPPHIPAYLSHLAAKLGTAQNGAAKSAGSNGNALLDWNAAREPKGDGRIPILERLLKNRTAHLLHVAVDKVPLDLDLLSLGMDSIMIMQLITELNAAYGIKLYPREVIEQPTLGALAALLATEIAKVSGEAVQSGGATAPRAHTTHSPFKIAPFLPVRHKLPRAVFLLSSPRSGSTLLRVMLAGHPQLFCPPELHLLLFDTLQERENSIGLTYLGEGLLRTLMETEGLDAAASKALVKELSDKGASSAELYQRIQRSVAPRMLVDKSPSYGLDMDSLWRAEHIFEDALYIHLVRHPLAVVESFARNRFDKMFGAPTDEPEQMAEQVWAKGNANVLDFARRIGDNRAHRIHYEDMVRQPEESMRKLCPFLGVHYDPAVLLPYEGGRMRDGLHAASQAVGDPNFEQHQGIDPDLGDAWRSKKLNVHLGPLLRAVSEELEYDLPEGVCVGPAQETVKASFGEFEESAL